MKDYSSVHGDQRHTPGLSQFLVTESSIVNEAIRTILGLFIFFFLRKDFERHKHVTSKNQVTKQKWANKKQQRQQFFASTKISKRVKIICFLFWCFFSRAKSFCKKNRPEIALITSFTILLTCTPINSCVKQKLLLEKLCELRNAMPCHWSSSVLPGVLQIWESVFYSEAFFTLHSCCFHGSLGADSSTSKLAGLYANLWNIAPIRLFVWITKIHKRGMVWW